MKCYSGTLEKAIIPPKITVLLILCALTCATPAKAQFKLDTTQKARTKRVWLVSQLLPGSGQIINKQYWKVPAYYAGMGGMIYMGVVANRNFNTYYNDYLNYKPTHDPLNIKEDYQIRYIEQRNIRNMCIAATGAIYLAGVMDAVVVYSKGAQSPTTATILSMLTPGAGQAYNKKYWKIPVIYGGFAGLYYGTMWNNKMYNKFKTSLIYRTDKDPTTVEPSWSKNRDDANLKYYIENFHRYRDICILGMAALYIANVLDANVDAHLFDWNVDDNLALKLEPSVVNSSDIAGLGETGVGLSLRITF